MKKLITTFALTAVCVGAFAQGRVNFVNDSLHRYYMSAETTELRAADQGLAGLRTPVNGALPSGVTLVADLYGGTSAGSLSLQATTTMSGIGPGSQNGANVILTGIPDSVPAFFQVHIRDNAFATAALAEAAGSYFGYSTVFTVVPLSGIAYASIVNKAAPANSTWADGTYVIPGITGFGAIEVQQIVPEPSSMALAGLGAASLLIFRRRK